MRKNSFGQSVLAVLVFVIVLFLIGTLGKTSEPKCIKAGCDNKRASGSDYCYIHKPSSAYHSTPSDRTTLADCIEAVLSRDPVPPRKS